MTDETQCEECQELLDDSGFCACDFELIEEAANDD